MRMRIVAPGVSELDNVGAIRIHHENFRVFFGFPGESYFFMSGDQHGHLAANGRFVI